MIHVGHSYIKKQDGWVRLCADVEIDGESRTAWYAVEEEWQDAFCSGRADPFVVLFFPCALRSSHRIICDDPISEKLHYQLLNYLMPSLVKAGNKYHNITIKAPFTSIPCHNKQGVGVGFSAGVDSLYSIYKHRSGCEYPVTHLAVFNAGAFDCDNHREVFFKACRKASAFAAQTELRTIFVDTNFYDILKERYLDVYSFRSLSCVLALQGLFAKYLLSSGHDIGHFKMDLDNSANYDLLTVNSVGTESLNVWLSGMETNRVGKLEELSEWELSYEWLHPCMYHYGGVRNCGKCKKCIMVQTALYAMGKLNLYKDVFDVDEFAEFLPQNIGLVLSKKGDETCEDAIRLFDKYHVNIPKEARHYARLFSMRKEAALRERRISE